MADEDREAPVRVERRGGVIALTLNRPEKLNAFNEAMHAALADGVAAAETDAAIRAVLLTGAGRAFSAGQDLGDRDPRTAEGPFDLGETLERFYHPLVRRMRALPKPIVVAVNGVAAGAGANVALAGDIVVAARSARFIQPFAKLGLVPDCGGAWTLARRIGEARAKALCLTAEPLGAEEAAAWGLIWKAVDDDALAAEAGRIAAALADGPTFGYAQTKAAIHAASEEGFDAALEREKAAQRACGRSPDYAEGVSAFLDKRQARFSGRAPS